MKVLYDYQIFHSQRFGGISNTFVSWIKNMPNEVNCTIGIKASDNVHLIDNNLVKVSSLRSYDNFLGGYSCDFKGKGRIYNYCRKFFPWVDSFYYNRKYSIDLLEKGDFDVFHPTFFSDYFIPHLHGKPYILTIYDMISEKFFQPDDMQTQSKKKMVQTAAHIIAISDKTKEDIIDILHVPESRITTIYLGSPEVQIIDCKPLVKGKYLLFVGNRGGYKNFLPMIRALAPVLSGHKDLKLVCTGNEFDVEELEVMNLCKIRDQVVQIKPSDSELRSLYANAQCFIFPSLYEGFGIPILEAWECNCPVLLNNKSCFPEIAHDAAIYFNLDENQSDLAEIMELFLIMSDEERNNLLTRQKERLTFFSWKKSAEQLYKVYQSVIMK